MTIIVFLIDTSASMNQRAYLGGRPTLLDVAKGAVETFVKVRQRTPESRGDRYMLLTFEDPPANIKAGWKENLATFINELKNLQCTGMTTMGAALKHAFDVLNINRMQTGIDTYGQGRCPFYLEPSVIVVITDGGKLSSTAGIQEDFNLPMNCPIPGSELTREPFRWDQRLFSLVLRLSGTPAIERDTGLVPSDSSPIDAMCEVTGGRSYCITSHRMMMQCIDSLVQKVQSGVVINFEKVGPDPPAVEVTPVFNREGIEGLDDNDEKEIMDVDGDKNGKWNSGANQQQMLGGQLLAPQAWHSCRRLIYVPRTVAQKGFAVGFWPIPESFKPDPNAPTLPPRSAHPVVKFTCTSQEPMVIDNLPFDKYELEPSPLTQFILARKQPTTCWQVFVSNGKSVEPTHPFGYLKASTNLSCVNLFVLPYNYPVLLPLLDDLFKIHRCKPPPEWKAAFQAYIDRMPSYYVAPLKRALAKMGASAALAQSLVPETQDNSLSFSVLNYLKRLKNQAKIEFDKLCNDVMNKAAVNNVKMADTIRVIPRSPLKKELTSHPCLQEKFTALRDQLNEFGGFVVGLSRGRNKSQAHTYRNPYDIQRRDLLDQVVRMRCNFLQASLAHTRLVDEDSGHCMAVSQMGNYQEYLKRMAPPLREIESPPVRQHMFGNPFKIDKRMMVDEADVESAGGASGGPGAVRLPLGKRKPGPLPAHLTARRPESPVPMSPPPPQLSPEPSPPPSPIEPVPSPSRTPTPPLVVTPARPISPPLVLANNIVNTASIVNCIPQPVVVPPTISAVVNVTSRVPAVVQQQAQLQQQPSINLPPVVKLLLNGDSSLTVTGKRPRSPSPTDTDSHQRQIHDILQGLTHGPSNTNPTTLSTLAPLAPNVVPVVHTPRKRTRSKSKEKSPPGPVHCKDLGEIRKHNMSVRAEAYKAVRRPGRDYTKVFEGLKQLKGGVSTKKEIVQQVIDESLRLKRKALAKLLQDFSDNLEKNGNGMTTTVKKELKSLTNTLYINNLNS